MSSLSFSKEINANTNVYTMYSNENKLVQTGFQFISVENVKKVFQTALLLIVSRGCTKKKKKVTIYKC